MVRLKLCIIDASESKALRRGMAHQKSHNPSQDAIITFCVPFAGASSGRISQSGSTAVSGLEINPILHVPVSFLPPRRMCLCRRRCWSHRRRTAHEKIFLIFMAFPVMLKVLWIFISIVHATTAEAFIVERGKSFQSILSRDVLHAWV